MGKEDQGLSLMHTTDDTFPMTMIQTRYALKLQLTDCA